MIKNFKLTQDAQERVQCLHHLEVYSMMLLQLFSNVNTYTVFMFYQHTFSSLSWCGTLCHSLYLAVIAKTGKFE